MVHAAAGESSPCARAQLRGVVANERIIAKAMQDYGMILTDTSGAVTMQAEDPRPYMAAHNTTTNPYDALFAGAASYAVLQDIRPFQAADPGEGPRNVTGKLRRH